ncbi:MAG: L,D-transpeptidase family protein [Myxococcota bacterium]
MRLPPFIQALAVVAVAAAPAVASAPSSLVGRGLAPVGDALFDVGFARLAPRLGAAARQRDDAGPGDALTKAVAADALLAAAYGPTPSFVLTDDAGLSPGGATVLSLLQAARYHGLELAPEAAATEWTGAPARPQPPAVPDAEIRAAWESASAASIEDRVARAVADLKARVPALAMPAPDDSGVMAKRVAAEVALARGLARLTAELPAKPRTTPSSSTRPSTTTSRPTSSGAACRCQSRPPPTCRPRWPRWRRAAVTDAFLTGRMPTHPQYAKLAAAAERHGGICAAGEWAAVALPASDKLAEKPEVAHAIAVRLAREGYVAGEPAAAWDDALKAAVASYRDTHQLKERSLVDKDLVDSLNVPCSERLRQLELNVRRWRHTGWTPSDTWVQVNLAGQELRFYKDSKLEMFQRTVVGSGKHFLNTRLQRQWYPNATPVLMDHIAQIIIDPEWNVPNRIARDEISVEIEKDPTYLESTLPRRHRQGRRHLLHPGPGAVERARPDQDLFPNDESVYLHDTPGKAAFKQSVRALSHGCVRVQNALDFGMALLAADAAAAHEAFDEAEMRARTFHLGQSVINLKREVPVYLEYYTASVGEDGLVRFHPDIYGYDAETFAATALAP